MVKRCDGALAVRFLGQAPHGLVTGGAEKEIGSASPTLSLWCSGWPPRPAWLHTVKSASVQSDLVLLLFLLLGGHDLVSLMNSRPKTPRLARPYYKHLVNEWKLNKSGDGAVTRDPGGKSRPRERAGRAAPPARRPSPGWTRRDWRPIRPGDRSPHQYTGRSPRAIAAGARLRKSQPARVCANAGRRRHRRPETHQGWPPWRSERRGGRWSANNR